MARLDGSLTMIFGDHPAKHGKNALTNRIISASCRSIYLFWVLELFLRERRPGNQPAAAGICRVARGSAKQQEKCRSGMSVLFLRGNFA
jgi:hypothetical protein